MRTITIISLATLMQFQAFTQIRNYQADKRRGYKVVSERATLIITPVKPVNENNVAVAAAALAVGSAVIDIGSDIAKEQLKKNAKKYEGEFKCADSKANFYSGTEGLLPSLAIVREIIISSNNTHDTAAIIELLPDISDDGTAFRFKLAACQYYYSIAKTKGKFQYLDVDLTIKFKAISFIKGE